MPGSCQCAEITMIAAGDTDFPNSASAWAYGPLSSAVMGEPCETKTAGWTPLSVFNPSSMKCPGNPRCNR
jgi:hypothetical protein